MNEPATEREPPAPWFVTDWGKRPGFFSTDDPQPQPGRTPPSRYIASAEPGGGLSDQANLSELNKQRGEATT